jgi:hypothetical protein
MLLQNTTKKKGERDTRVSMNRPVDYWNDTTQDIKIYMTKKKGERDARVSMNRPVDDWSDTTQDIKIHILDDTQQGIFLYTATIGKYCNIIGTQTNS